MMNMKKGNTKSVGVSPFHSAWLKGAYILPQLPGLLTRIIPAMVIPLSTSSANRRCDALVSLCRVIFSLLVFISFLF